MIAAEILSQRTRGTVLERYGREIMNSPHLADYVERLVANLLGYARTFNRAEG